MLTNKVIILIVFALAVVFNLQSVAHADGHSEILFEEDFESYISMMKNKDKFEIINRWIEDEELNEFFQKSSIVVMPYIEASQSNIPLLAYYFKKPIIATNVGGIPELIINGKSGILVPPRDEYSLAKAITLVLKNNSLRERLVKNGSHLLNNTFTWEKTADQAINCYNKCLIE